MDHTIWKETRFQFTSKISNLEKKRDIRFIYSWELCLKIEKMRNLYKKSTQRILLDTTLKNFVLYRDKWIVTIGEEKQDFTIYPPLYQVKVSSIRIEYSTRIHISRPMFVICYKRPRY